MAEAIPGAVRIAIVGAESTGKTTLARALAERIGAETGLRCGWVSELLRDWCDTHRRTPRIDEQTGIARAQQARIDAASASHDVLVCDTTALMTAVYSSLVFGDSSLEAYAIEQQRRFAVTLLTALDLPWVADGLQRDGVQVQVPVDSAVRRLLMVHRLPWGLVSGLGQARVKAALDAVAPLLCPNLPLGASHSTPLVGRGAPRQVLDWAGDKSAANTKTPRGA